jgi:hypothetical protein
MLGLEMEMGKEDGAAVENDSKCSKRVDRNGYVADCDQQSFNILCNTILWLCHR